jgi:hypothetical protein
MIAAISVRLRIAALGLLALSVSGCAPAITPRYYPSAKTAIALRDLAALRPQSLVVGKFEGGPESASCRLAPISPPDRQSFAEFIRGAFIDELSLAGLAADKAGSEFRGTIKSLDVDCNVGTGLWTIAFEYSVGGKLPVLVKADYEFEGAFAGVTVFNNAQQALVPAVQELIRQIVTSAEFQAAVR